MNDDKERIVIINNIKGLFEEGRVIGSVVDIDESCKPAVEVYYLSHLKKYLNHIYNNSTYF